MTSGRAIFSLEGKGERKVLPLSGFPRQAQWVALKDYPTVRHDYDSENKATSTTMSYDQEGTVWQAEELLVDGKWRAYFGFVGKHCLAAVPGDEIQFETQDYYEPFQGWGFRLDLIGDEDPHGWRKRLTAKVGDAIPTKVWIKNLWGSERAFSLFRHAAGPTSPGDLGLSIQLDYCPQPVNAIFTFPPSPEPKWEPVAAKAPLRVDLSPVAATLSPLAKNVLFQLDLAKEYDLKWPGSYRLTLKFKKAGRFDSAGSISPQYFELTD